jgi:hypothetical protein
MRRLGRVGGNALAIAGESPLPVVALTRAFEDWLPAYMADQTG